jgi:hypothetical protein
MDDLIVYRGETLATKTPGGAVGTRYLVLRPDLFSKIIKELPCTCSEPGSLRKSFENLSGCGNLAVDTVFHTDHRQGRLVQGWIARHAGIAHRDTTIPEIDGSAQGRADAYVCGDTRQDQRFNAALGHCLLQRGMSERTISKLVYTYLLLRRTQGYADREPARRVF